MISYVPCCFQEAFEQRMRDINMGKAEFESYERFRNVVQQHATQLRLILEEMTTRAKERVWLRNQNQGELDDAKLVDGLTGDRCALLCPLTRWPC